MFSLWQWQWQRRLWWSASLTACVVAVSELVRTIIQRRLADRGLPDSAKEKLPHGQKSKTDVTADLPAGLKPAFEKRVAELIAFRERVGHVDVPLDSATSSSLTPKGLGRWVYAQRKRKLEGKLTPEEEAALNTLGFRWQLNVEDVDWDEMVERLIAYKTENGDCLVPKKFEKDPLLGAWVCACRRKADPLLNGGESALPSEQKDVLDKVGFVWVPERRCGSSFMKGLRAYGDAHAAGNPPPDEQWCEAQREARRQGKLSDQRIAYLDKFEFDWGLQA